jgi:hypothetical protein
MKLHPLKFSIARCARCLYMRFELLSVLIRCFGAKFFKKTFKLKKHIPAQNYCDV